MAIPTDPRSDVTNTLWLDKFIDEDIAIFGPGNMSNLRLVYLGGCEAMKYSETTADIFFKLQGNVAPMAVIGWKKKMDYLNGHPKSQMKLLNLRNPKSW